MNVPNVRFDFSRLTRTNEERTRAHVRERSCDTDGHCEDAVVAADSIGRTKWICEYEFGTVFSWEIDLKLRSSTFLSLASGSADQMLSRSSFSNPAFISLPALNLTTARRGMMTSFSGWFGFLPTLDFLTCSSKTPKFRSSTFWPWIKPLQIWSRVFCTISVTCLWL